MARRTKWSSHPVLNRDVLAGSSPARAASLGEEGEMFDPVDWPIKGAPVWMNTVSAGLLVMDTLLLLLHLVSLMSV